MEYILIYLVIGLVVSIVISQIDKIQMDDGDCDTLSNADRILYVIIWPVMTYIIVKELLIGETQNK